MRIALSLTMLCTIAACGSTPDDRPAGVADETPPQYVEPDETPDAPASPAFHLDFAALGLKESAAGTYQDENDGRIKGLYLYEPQPDGMGLQIHVIHGHKEVGTPAGVLLKHAKMYRTQVAPETPFPKVEESADKKLALNSVLVRRPAQADLHLSAAYRRLDGVAGVVMVEGVNLGQPRLTAADIDRLDDLVRMVATRITVR